MTCASFGSFLSQPPGAIGKQAADDTSRSPRNRRSRAGQGRAADRQNDHAQPVCSGQQAGDSGSFRVCRSVRRCPASRHRWLLERRLAAHALDWSWSGFSKVQIRHLHFRDLRRVETIPDVLRPGVRVEGVVVVDRRARDRPALIEPGKPWQNGATQASMTSSATNALALNGWRLHCNAVCPHSSLGYLTPNEFVVNKHT